MGVLDVNLIVRVIDDYLDKSKETEISAILASQILDKLEILNDSKIRPGSNLRRILRNGYIEHAYKKGANWFIPHSKIIGQTTSNLVTNFANVPNEKSITVDFTTYSDSEVKVNKLSSIAECVSKYLENKYQITPKYSFEYSPYWLSTIPNKIDLLIQWDKVSEVYSSLLDNRYSLEERIIHVKKEGLQKYDIWFHEPFSFAVEFDESQHFNQFRSLTLAFYSEINTGFNIEDYKLKCDETIVKPGKSGFHCLKNEDPLFPKLFEGENQDNRHRQRAFRDYLKDLLPVAYGCNPTFRIPYHIVNKTIRDFNSSDVAQIGNFISESNLKIIIRNE